MSISDPSVPQHTLRRLIQSAWISQAVHAAAAIGLADQLPEGSTRSAAELAAATGADETALRRLLRALATLGVVTGRDGDRWELTAVGALLRGDAPASLRAYAQLHGRQLWALWGRLPEAVRSGRPPTARAPFDRFAADDAAGAVFGAAMAGATAAAAAALVQAMALDDVRVLMDVGGGQGQLLEAALRAHPTLRGYLVDLPYAIEPARARFEAAGLSARSVLQGVDFFDALPGDADAAVLKSVLHDWSDDRCAVLLERCRRALGGGRLFVIERLLPEPVTDSPADRDVIASDLAMLIATGGRERTGKELHGLLAANGFRVHASTTVAASGGYTVIDARC